MVTKIPPNVISINCIQETYTDQECSRKEWLQHLYLHHWTYSLKAHFVKAAPEENTMFGLDPSTNGVHTMAAALYWLNMGAKPEQGLDDYISLQLWAYKCCIPTLIIRSLTCSATSADPANNRTVFKYTFNGMMRSQVGIGNKVEYARSAVIAHEVATPNSCLSHPTPNPSSFPQPFSFHLSTSIPSPFPLHPQPFSLPSPIPTLLPPFPHPNLSLSPLLLCPPQQCKNYRAYRWLQFVGSKELVVFHPHTRSCGTAGMQQECHVVPTRVLRIRHTAHQCAERQRERKEKRWEKRVEEEEREEVEQGREQRVRSETRKRESRREVICCWSTCKIWMTLCTLQHLLLLICTPSLVKCPTQCYNHNTCIHMHVSTYTCPPLGQTLSGWVQWKHFIINSHTGVIIAHPNN